MSGADFMRFPPSVKKVCFVSAQDFLSPKPIKPASELQKIVLFEATRDAVKAIPSSLFMRPTSIHKKLGLPPTHKLLVYADENAQTHEVRKLLAERKVPFTERFIFRKLSKSQPHSGKTTILPETGRHSHS
ncbi:MAG: hypothetical protein V1817_03230 [Candidatus Micrarchaeota archaeon]